MTGTIVDRRGTDITATVFTSFSGYFTLCLIDTSIIVTFCNRSKTSNFCQRDLAFNYSLFSDVVRKLLIFGQLYMSIVNATMCQKRRLRPMEY